jgi:hypothetical protein
MVTISETDLQTQFGRYKALALREPVSIATGGAETLVMLSGHRQRGILVHIGLAPITGACYQHPCGSSPSER